MSVDVDASANGADTVVRSDARDLDPSELAQRPVTVLLGVSQPAAAALAEISIATVFDLAASTLFANARRVVEIAEGDFSTIARAGVAPLDLIDAEARTLPVAELELQPISVLRQLDAPGAKALSDALNVTTIRDLAFWPPYRDALAIVNEAYGGSAFADDEAEPSTPELVPAAGRYPTERVQYELIVLDRIGKRPASSGDTGPSTTTGHPGPPVGPPSSGGGGVLDAGSTPIAETQRTALETSGPIDIAAAAAGAGFAEPAVGALLTMTQSWYTMGLALGQLLHAVALAPGESTRIAMIDWSRRSRAATTESIVQGEQLSSTLGRNRSIAEVTKAVANETQGGSSGADAASIAASYGFAGGLAGGLIDAGASAAAAVGQSFGLAGGFTHATTWASSGGDRHLGADSTQRIQDVTQQASNSTRNRWATVVREVSQSEHEELSTRAITNYNHMHALTLQYYEVVQLYRTVVELSRVTRALFVPMKPLDFSQPSLIERFGHVIAAAGLTPAVRALRRAAPDTVVLSSPDRVGPWDQNGLDFLESMVRQPVGTPDSRELALPYRFQMLGLSFEEEAPYESVVLERAAAPDLVFPLLKRDPGDIIRFGTHYASFGSLLGDEDERQLWDITAIRLRKKAGQEDYDGTVAVSVPFDRALPPGVEPVAGQAEGASLRIALKARKGASSTTIFEALRTVGEIALRRHLSANSLYYSQAIWRSLDPATLGLVLSSYTFEGAPLLEIVDPLPVTVAGNYLVFRMTGGEASEEWKAFLARTHLEVGYRRGDVVPLPSGGVFAEAVLGRANSAEKLDITRFWNWQDSPIPIEAPEIAALQAGSRAQVEDLKPGELGSPVLNIVNPPNLPDPVGLTAIIGALQKGDMFRDLSGLASTAQLAQAALGGAFQGAEAAAAQAGTNAATAANLLSSLYGNRSPGTISNTGARINQGRDMDDRGVDGSHEGDAFTGDITPPVPLPTEEPSTPTPTPTPAPPRPPRRPPRPPATKQVEIILSAHYENGDVFDGDFDLAVEAGQTQHVIGLHTSGQGRASALVPLTPGEWSFWGNVVRTMLPNSVTAELPVTVFPGVITKIDAGALLDLPRRHRAVNGFFTLSPGRSQVVLRATAKLQADKISRSFTFSGGAGMETTAAGELKAQAEESIIVAGAKEEIGGSLGVTVKADLSVSTTISYDVTYSKLVGVIIEQAK
jgi:hypothetical protein